MHYVAVRTSIVGHGKLRLQKIFGYFNLVVLVYGYNLFVITQNQNTLLLYCENFCLMRSVKQDNLNKLVKTSKGKSPKYKRGQYTKKGTKSEQKDIIFKAKELENKFKMGCKVSIARTSAINHTNRNLRKLSSNL
jgi:hypothetical protein